MGRLNKAAADVAVLDKSNTVRNTALLGIAQGGVQAAVRHADDNIRVYRVLLRQVRTGPHSGVLHRHALNHTVRPSKIDVLKHTNVAWSAAMGGNGAYAFLADHNDLAGSNIPHKVSADGIQRTTLRRHHISIVRSLAQAKRPKAIGVAKRNEFGGSHHHARECPLQPGHDFFDCLFRALTVQALLYNRIGNGLGVRCAVKNGALQLIFLPKFCRIDQVAVVGNGHRTFYMSHNQRLRIGTVIAAGGAVAHMTDGNVPKPQLFHMGLVEYLRHQPKILMIGKHTLVIDYNAAAFLSPVLQRIQRHIGLGCHIPSLLTENTEYTAFLMDTCYQLNLIPFRSSSMYKAHTGACPPP